MLRGPGGRPRYEGNLQDLQSSSGGWHLRALLQGPGTRSLAVQGDIAMTPDGQISGTLQGAPR